jgi:hypothetical protein
MTGLTPQGASRRRHHRHPGKSVTIQ